MIRFSNPYDVKPLPKEKLFSFGKFSKRLSLSSIQYKDRAEATERGLKKGVVGWRNPAGEVKILEREINLSKGKKVFDKSHIKRRPWKRRGES